MWLPADAAQMLKHCAVSVQEQKSDRFILTDAPWQDRPLDTKVSLGR